MAERMWRPTASKILQTPGVMWNKFSSDCADYERNIRTPHDLVVTLSAGRQVSLPTELQGDTYYCVVCQGMNYVPWSNYRIVVDEELAYILGSQIVLPKTNSPLWPHPIEYINILWPSPYYDPKFPRLKRPEAECSAGLLIESDTPPPKGHELISRKKGWYAQHGYYGFVSCKTAEFNSGLKFSLEKRPPKKNEAK